jgi:D-threo-aldose 1-dehydrogenase
MRLPTGRSRAAVLNAAYDAGIRHFDVARMYGLGRAEHELGNFIQGRREHITVATKFGIEVNEAAGRLAMVQGLARQMLRLAPGLRRIARKRSASLYVPKDFSAAAARRSLEASLRALQTDYVDMFLLHEPVLAEVENTGILEYLEQARQAGYIRSWGLAGYPEQVGPIAEAMPGLAPVLQVPNDMVNRQLDAFRQQVRALITFSPLSRAQEIMSGLVKRSPELARVWSKQLDMDITGHGRLNELLLAWCLGSNPQGIVLFSSTNKDHVADAVRLVDDTEMREKSVIFEQLVHQALAMT